MSDLPASASPAAPSSSVPSFTGDASPYGGGDPYADYRTADFPFTSYANLADRQLGAGVIAANDEFFAQRENILVAGRAVFDPEHFGHKGKVMDGWETRRRRGVSAEHPWPADDDHDWALLRLGAPGVIRGVVIDTAHFRGNYPRAVSVEAVALPGAPSPDDLLSDDVKWTTLVERALVGGHAANGFAVDVEQRFTHVRITQHPDGGIARVRVYGEVVADPGWLGALGTFDVVALENGGQVEGASDLFYSPATHSIQPGRSRKMDDGWETRRRRDHGNDWIRYRLVAESEIRAIEIDTAYLKGNAAGWASISIRTGEGAWTEVLPRTRLQPDTNHRFVLDTPAVGTHARVDIYPDGGISRLRLFGSLTKRGATQLAARHQQLGT
ncbi:allantoicase [Streptomyces sp. NPDC058001]|uniref:allantoicase n=1 Tax=Streptomyces sp. NPDC058001 TaxID=3346300 RepID=UPI0036E189CB